MAGAMPDDLARVDAVLKGDEDQARALVERLHPLVMRIVRSHLPKRTDEADLSQTIFLKVFANIEQFSGKVPLEHWVSRIAVNTCLNQLKRERARPELRRADLSSEQDQVLDLLRTSETDLSPPGQLAARELAALLLQSLTPKERLLITMLYLEGHTLREVHELTGWGVTALKLRSFRARRKMRKTLKTLLQESPP